jgi:type IV secretory pathway VirB4 component
LHVAAGSGHAINILDPLRTPDPEDSNDQLTDVLDLVSVMCGGMDPLERAHLEEAVRTAIGSPKGIPVLGDVCTILDSRQQAPRLAAILKRWTTGELGQLFSAPTNVDMTADLIGFNLRDLKDEVVGPAYLLLANWLWARLRRDRRPRHLLIDEAGLLLEHEVIRRFLVRLARRIRKYRGSLILVTQNPGDLFESKDGAVLATNPSLLMLGSLKHSEAVKVQKAFSLTDRQVASLETARRGDFLLLAGPNRVPLHVMVPPWMDELIVQFRDRPSAGL